jgi:hypothetical protein
VIFECKEGRRAILADIVIDASGDGDVFARAGAPFEIQDKEASVNLRLGGVDWDAILAWRQRDPEGLKAQWAETRARFGSKHGWWRLGHRPGIANVNTAPDEKINILDARELTRIALECRERNLRLVEYLRRETPGFENAHIIATAPMVGCRASRRLKGLYQLNEADIYALKTFEDSVMLGACFYMQRPENYPAGKPEHAVCEVPYRCLVPETLDGLLAAGRCVSCTYGALNWVRDLPFVMASGQVAGVAAAQCVTGAVQPRAANVARIQSDLGALGAPCKMPAAS